MQGDFGDHVEVRKVTKTKNRMLGSKMGELKTTVSDVKDSILNNFASVANALSGSEGVKLEVGKLRDVERLFHLEAQKKSHRKSWEIWGNRKTAADLGEKEKIAQLQEEKKRKIRLCELRS